MDMQDPSKPSAIVRLHDARSGAFFCSGVVTSDKIVMTAGHCVAGRGPLMPFIEVRDSEGQSHAAYAIIALGEERSDQGVLIGDFSAFNHMHALTDTWENTIAINSGHKFITCGFPYGAKLFCSQFVYKAFRTFHYFGYGYLYPGCSGGAVIDATNGNVIATNYAAPPEGILVNPLSGIFENLGVPEAFRQ
ncbi:MAG: hypothetical protein NVS1B10_06630 [Candidatus Saccharimonadales bacterium]